jgi:UDP-N-acetylglucosamine diphosphorylase/glucosamine-1-phosphate N-acetyltransferase
VVASRLSTLVCYDDARARAFEPFALSRPWSEMRVGALLVRERWSLALGAQARGFVADHALRDFREGGAPRSARGTLRAGTIVANSRCAIGLEPLGRDAAIYRVDGRVAAVRLAEDVPVAELADGSLTLDALARRQYGRRKGITVRGDWCDAVWDVIRHLNTLLMADLPQLALTVAVHALDADAVDSTLIGTDPAWVSGTAHIEPHVVFDTTTGPVFIDAGAQVQAFTRLSGPLYVGRDTVINGGRVSGSAIGDRCKVHGELSATVLVGHANKGHDGFVGHSVLGRWVNLGAGTTTSNLKNTYGPVALWTPDGVHNTGLQFLGTLFGDHVKTGIGLCLTTGCVLGLGANVVDAMPPKVVAPFSWGARAPYATYDLAKFLETAERVMSRRAVELDRPMRALLTRAHARRWTLD